MTHKIELGSYYWSTSLKQVVRTTPSSALKDDEVMVYTTYTGCNFDGVKVLNKDDLTLFENRIVQDFFGLHIGYKPWYNSNNIIRHFDFINHPDKPIALSMASLEGQCGFYDITDLPIKLRKPPTPPLVIPMNVWIEERIDTLTDAMKRQFEHPTHSAEYFDYHWDVLIEWCNEIITLKKWLGANE